jgi:hypothetical protein
MTQRPGKGDRGKEAVLTMLRDLGFNPESIPESPVEGEKSPDVRICTSKEIILVEVKRKRDEDGYFESIDGQIKAQGSVVKIDPLESKRALLREVREASEQLNAHADANHALRILWVIPEAFDDVDQFWFWRYSLYGIGCIADLAEPVAPPHPPASVIESIATLFEAVECDYFHESGFHSQRNLLDGVIVQQSSGATLLINDYSSRAERLLSSEFSVKVASHLVHPRLRPGPLLPRYLADCDGDRRDIDATLEYVASKYGLREPRLMPMKRSVVYAEFPMRETDAEDKSKSG